jgi:small subunit ribosomal protein S7
MPRRGEVQARPVEPDSIYNSALVTQVINKVMTQGKKSTAEQIVYGALEGAREKSGTDPVVTLRRALDNVKPTLEVRSRRVGGATYQVPVDVRPDRSQALGMRWLVTYSRERGEKTMQEKLAAEILDALNEQGGAYKRKDDIYRMAQANKAFAHYRW